MNPLPRQNQMIGEKVQGHYIQNAHQRLFNQSMSKTWPELFQIEGLFHRYHDFEQVVELGTGTGTCTLFLALHGYFHTCKVYTFDNQDVPSRTLELLEKLNVLWYKGDIFSEEFIEKISTRIEMPGRTLLYCDNGKKTREVEVFAPKLKQDDILLIHDYTEEVFDADIERYCNDYNMNIIEKDWIDSFIGMHIALIKK